MTDRCEITDLRRGECAHCGASPGIGFAFLRYRLVVTGARGGRDMFPSEQLPAADFRPSKALARSAGGDRQCACGRPTRDAAYVCDDCLDELAKALGNVPWLVEQLDVSLTKVRGIDYARDSGHGATIPLAHIDVDDDGDVRADAATTLPYHDGAASALGVLRHALVTWVRFCDEESVRNQSPIIGLPNDTLQSLAAWLLWRVDGLGLSDLGPDAVSEITRAVGRCQSTIDRPAERRYVGPCECGRDLYSKPGAKVTKCQSCEREYDAEAMRAWMRAGVAGRLVTAREGTALLGRFDLPTAQKTIDKWHERKRLVDHGSDATGARLYLLDDLISLAAQNVGKLA